VPYAELEGSLLFLSQCRRPDFAYDVGVLSRRMSAHKLEYWELAKRMVRYLRGTVSFELCYGATVKLCGYTDSEFAGDGTTAKSTTGCVFELGGAAIFWASKRQTVVATCTCEAEYIAAAFGA
jgi:hypothetical protein